MLSSVLINAAQNAHNSVKKTHVGISWKIDKDSFYPVCQLDDYWQVCERKPPETERKLIVYAMVICYGFVV